MTSPGTPQGARTAVLRTLSRLRLVVTALVIGIGLAACGSGEPAPKWQLSDKTGPAGDAAWQKLVADAKAEGRVVIYGAHAEDTLNQLGAAFEKQYGIKVQVFRAADSDLQPKLDAEIKTGNHVADVVGMSDENYLKRMSARGAFADPRGPALSAPGFDRKANTLARGVNRSVATTMSYAWNTERHPKGLRGFNDLLDPSLSGGKIGVLAPFTPAVMDFYTYLQKQNGADYLDKLAKQKPRKYQAGAAMAEALASGEIAAATQVAQVALYKAKDAGAPVDGGLANPAWGAGLYEAVLEGAAHPNAAQLLMNYIFTPAGQEIVANRTAAVLPNIPKTATTADKTTTGGVMNASPEQFKAFVDKFNGQFR
ncbi:extracellular solute-binding protein [Actinomadura vinacea]|uniref:extracellular solute-binding protein n=1 Tax=Actinomadura vinacea TaxID=115336 RepID=UPI0031DFCA80